MALGRVRELVNDLVVSLTGDKALVLTGLGLLLVLGLFGGLPQEKAQFLEPTDLTQASGQRVKVVGVLIDWQRASDGRPLITIQRPSGEQVTAYVADTAKVGRGLIGHGVEAVGTLSPGGLLSVDTSLLKAKALTPYSDLTEVEVKDGIARGRGQVGAAPDLPDGVHRGRWLADTRGRLLFQAQAEEE